MSQDDQPKIFISHCHADRAEVDVLVELIRLSIDGIKGKDVRYTSSPVTGLAPGAWITSQLISDIHTCKCFIAVISDSYLSSEFCLLEFGARLASQDSTIIPVHLDGINPVDVGGILSGMKLGSLMDEESVRDVIQRIAKLWNFESNPSQKKLTELCNQTRTRHSTQMRKWRESFVRVEGGRVFVNTYGLAERPVERTSFQNFHPTGSNIQPVQYLWADPRHGNSIHAILFPKAQPKDSFLRIDFKHKPGSLGCNFAIRPLDRAAIITQNYQITLSVRIPKESPMKKIGLKIRLVNGYMQHWEKIGMLCVSSSQFRDVTFDFRSPCWNIFDSDGAANAGPQTPDFSIISSVVISVGGYENMGLNPISGEGILDIRSIENK